MEVKEIKALYKPAHATSSNDFGKCYYCGCEADKVDYVPPIKHYDFYSATNPELPLMIIPACKECRDFLVDDREGEIDKRFEYVKRRLQYKYRKALQIYYSWTEDESLDELASHFQKSIKSGLKLGKEAYERVSYLGFEYDVDGFRSEVRHKKKVEFDVYGEKFDNFRNALLYASRAYRINVNTLRDLLVDNNGDFNKAIKDYHEALELELFEKKKKKLCEDFAKEYKQNKNFVIRALDHYLKKSEGKDIKKCLALIYNERIKK